MDSIEEYLIRYFKMSKTRFRRMKSKRSHREGFLTPTPQSFLQKISKEKGAGDVTEEIFNEENKSFCNKVLNSRSGSPFKTPPPSFYPSDKAGFLGHRLKTGREGVSQYLGQRKTELVLPTLRKKSENSMKIEQILKSCEETRNLVIETSSRLKFFVNQDHGVMKMYAKKVARTSDVLMQVGGHKKEIQKVLFEHIGDFEGN